MHVNVQRHLGRIVPPTYYQPNASIEGCRVHAWLRHGFSTDDRHEPIIRMITPTLTGMLQYWWRIWFHISASRLASVSLPSSWLCSNLPSPREKTLKRGFELAWCSGDPATSSTQPQPLLTAGIAMNSDQSLTRDPFTGNRSSMPAAGQCRERQGV
jgi:hypothetical protein